MESGIDANGDMIERIVVYGEQPKSSPSLDKRDLRSPQKLGEEYLRTKEFNALVPDYPQDESMCMVTQREYREELEARVAEGDKYAKSAIERIENERGGRVSRP